MTVPSAIIVAGIALATASVDAEPRSDGLHFTYAVATTCPPKVSFESAVRARVEPGAARSETVIALSVDAREDGFEGQLAVDRAGAPTSRRTLAGPSCDEVVEALALIAALAVNATAAPPPAPALAIAVAPQPSPARRIAASAGVVGGVYQGLAPGAAFGGEVYVEAAFEGESFVQPSVRLGFAAATRAATAGDGRATFTWTVGQVTACPLQFELGHGVALTPCGRIDVGALHVSGAGVGQSQRDTKPWFAPSIVARFTWRIGRRARLELEGGAIVPLVRNHYFFPPSTAVYEIPAVAAVARSGISLEF